MRTRVDYPAFPIAFGPEMPHRLPAVIARRLRRVAARLWSRLFWWGIGF